MGGRLPTPWQAWVRKLWVPSLAVRLRLLARRGRAIKRGTQLEFALLGGSKPLVALGGGCLGRLPRRRGRRGLLAPTRLVRLCLDIRATCPLLLGHRPRAAAAQDARERQGGAQTVVQVRVREGMAAVE